MEDILSNNSGIINHNEIASMRVSIPLREDILSNVIANSSKRLLFDEVSIPLREDILSNP